MRLLSTDAKAPKFIEVDYATEPYVALSHTWISPNTEEVSFQELHNVLEASQGQEILRSKEGLEKIISTSRLARREGFKYVWIDTCCINKSSSAELDEALRSMFRWYQEAEVCYVYLSDVKSTTEEDPMMEDSSFGQSRWFKRGWTLQELLAPKKLCFFAYDWSILRVVDKTSGSGKDWKFLRRISQITGINETVLSGHVRLDDTSISARMSWASGRQTTRIEDSAYCLMGIFDVHMNARYGEGSTAFVRLQRKILKSSDDQSIFAWKCNSDDNRLMYGLLADSPEYFRSSGTFSPSPPVGDSSPAPWEWTNQGLKIQLFLSPVSNRPEDDGEYRARLECFSGPGSKAYSPSLRLCHLGGNHFARILVHTWENTPVHSNPEGEVRVVFIQQLPGFTLPQFEFIGDRVEDDTGLGYRLDDRYTLKYQDHHRLGHRFRFFHGERSETLAIFRFQFADGACDDKVVGLDVAVGLRRHIGRKFRPWCVFRRNLGDPFSTALRDINTRVRAQALDLIKMTNFDIIRVDDWERLPMDAEIDIRPSCANCTARNPVFEIDIHPKVPMLDSSQHVHTSWLPSTNGPRNEIPTTLSLEDEFQVENQLKRLFKQAAIENTIEWSVFPNEYLTDKVRTLPQSSQTAFPESFSSIINSAEFETRFGLGPLATAKTLFLKACRGGDQYIIEDLLQQNSQEPYRTELLECGSESFHGFKGLHWAAVRGHRRIVTILIREGASVDGTTKQGWTALHLATMLGDYHTMQTIIRSARRQSRNINHLLLSQGQSGYRCRAPEETIYHLAAANRENFRSEVLNHLFWFNPGLEEGTQGECSNNRHLRTRNYLDETPLHRAAATDNTAVTLMITTVNPDTVHDTDKFGRTPLWHAACADSAGSIRHLVGAGALIELGDDDGVTPLHAACREDKPDAVRALLSLGANPHARTPGLGLTPAHFAAAYGHYRCLKLLFDGGADLSLPTTCDGYRITPSRLEQVNRVHESSSILDQERWKWWASKASALGNTHSIIVPRGYFDTPAIVNESHPSKGQIEAAKRLWYGREGLRRNIRRWESIANIEFEEFKEDPEEG